MYCYIHILACIHWLVLSFMGKKKERIQGSILKGYLQPRGFLIEVGKSFHLSGVASLKTESILIKSPVYH